MAQLLCVEMHASCSSVSASGRFSRLHSPTNFRFRSPQALSPKSRHSVRDLLRTVATLRANNSFHNDVAESTSNGWTFPGFDGLFRYLSSPLMGDAEDAAADDSEGADTLQSTQPQPGCTTHSSKEINRRVVLRPREMPRSEWAYRREITLYGVAALLAIQAWLPCCVQPALAEGLSTAAEAPVAAAPSRSLRPDTTITQRVFLEFQLCPTAVRLERTLGDRSLICRDGEPMGKVVLGLYGNQVPVTVQHFVDMVTGKAGSSYKGSIIQKSLPGQYIMAGRQGAVDKGEVKPPSELELNPETVQSRSFLLDHMRPGTLSLALSENDDDSAFKERSAYRNVEFLITTGPGPASQLDSRNIVFGTVLEGMDVVQNLASVPSNQPNERIRQFNDLAVLLGDDRAAKGRSSWGKPLKAIVISNCGVETPAEPAEPAELLPPQPLLPPSQP